MCLKSIAKGGNWELTLRREEFMKEGEGSDLDIQEVGYLYKCISSYKK